MTTYIGNSPAGAKDFVTDTPIGSIMAWASATLPLGWIECNGQSTTPYPELAFLGATVPDLRGEFIRGFDNGRGIDVGRVLGSAQADEFESHNHSGLASIEREDGNVINWGDTGSLGGITIKGGAVNTGNNAQNAVILEEGGIETRPRNIAQIFIIKAFNVIKENGAVNHYIGKNYIINPVYNINQRGFAGGALGVGIYGVDRFRALGAGATVTYSAGVSTVTVEQMMQVVERIEGVVGVQPMTLSWEGTSTFEIGEANGNTYITDATSPYTFTPEDLADGDIRIIQNVGTCSKLKLEVGSVQTPFEYPDTATELSKCQRYYERVAPSIRVVATSAQNFDNTVVFVSKRVSPTRTLVTAGNRVNVSLVALVSAGFAPHNSARLQITSVGAGSAHALSDLWELDAEL